MPEKKTKPKPKAKPKQKPKPKPKKETKPKAEKVQKVIVEIEKKEKEPDEKMYSDKLKHLISKIKNQNNFTDSGIRFAWKN